MSYNNVSSSFIIDFFQIGEVASFVNEYLFFIFEELGSRTWRRSFVSKSDSVC